MEDVSWVVPTIEQVKGKWVVTDFDGKEKTFDHHTDALVAFHKVVS